MRFNFFWKLFNSDWTEHDYLIKSSQDKLTPQELKKIQEIIHKMQQEGASATKIIEYLQGWNEKLQDKYKAQRAFWTELKRLDTTQVKDSGHTLDLDEYKVLLSPNACPLCRQKTRDGSKVFKSSDLAKDGFGHVPPFHPNCYCVLIPI